MKKIDIRHLPQHIIDAFNDAGVDEDSLDSAIEALAELGVRMTLRDNEANETYPLAAFSELCTDPREAGEDEGEGLDETDPPDSDRDSG